MEKENVETVPPENEEEPQVFAVTRDVNGSHFNRRDFIEKTVIASAAVTVAASGCTLLETAQGTMAQATANAAKLTEIAQGQAAPPTEPPPAATNTATQVPTNTTVPTETPVPPTPTPSNTPTPQGIPSTVKGDNVNFRAGPGTGYTAITRLPYGASITLVSRLADSSWVGVALVDPRRGGMVQGWIKTNLVDTAGKDIKSLPVITDIPPTPTPLPGRYGNTRPGETGIDYSYTDEYGNVYNFTLPCGAAIPPGATCTCNCVTVPRTCSCVDHVSGCSCDVVHYWYPN